MKLFPYILFEKCTYIFALNAASPRNQHCASCIGTLSFPVWRVCVTRRSAVPEKRWSPDSSAGRTVGVRVEIFGQTSKYMGET